MNTRNYGIDLGRWIFAFLIVTLHMGIFFPDVFHPLARNGVPFFFLVTGYFLANATRTNYLRAAKKWMSIWGTYLLILGIGCLIIKGGVELLDNQWVVELITTGCPSSLSIHRVNEYHLDPIVPLWFVYQGGLALSIIGTVLINRKKLLIAGALLVLLGPVMNYVLKIEMPSWSRLFYSAIPFLCIGRLCCSDMGWIYKLGLVRWMVIVALAVICIMEHIYLKEYRSHNSELLVSNIPMAVLLFLKLRDTKLPLLLEHLMQWLPVKCTLDIYIWHCFTRYILELLGISLYAMAAPSVFILLALITILVRKVQKGEMLVKSKS